MDVSVDQKLVWTRVFKTPFGEFEVYDAMKILDELEGTQNGFSHLIIYNPDLGKWLESLGACSKSIRGSYYRGEKYQEVYDGLSNLIL